jgi:hypothetical protein
MPNPTQRLGTRLIPYAPTVLSLFRVVFGNLFLCHATSICSVGHWHRSRHRSDRGPSSTPEFSNW